MIALVGVGVHAPPFAATDSYLPGRGCDRRGFVAGICFLEADAASVGVRPFWGYACSWYALNRQRSGVGGTRSLTLGPSGQGLIGSCAGLRLEMAVGVGVARYRSVKMEIIVVARDDILGQHGVYRGSVPVGRAVAHARGSHRRAEHDARPPRASTEHPDSGTALVLVWAGDVVCGWCRGVKSRSRHRASLRSACSGRSGCKRAAPDAGGRRRVRLSIAGEMSTCKVSQRKTYRCNGAARRVSVTLCWSNFHRERSTARHVYVGTCASRENEMPSRRAADASVTQSS